MDFPPRETRSKKKLRAVILLIFVLIAIIIGIIFYLRNKTGEVENLDVPIQEPNNKINPAPASLQGPSALPEKVTQPPEKERVPPPLP